MPSISVLIKPASSLCNMRCGYCFYRDEARNRSQESFGFMSGETLKNVIRRTLPKAEGGISYVFQGGEPTLRGLEFFRKAVQYQQQYNKKRLPIQNSLQTNGLLLDEEWCRFLKEHRFLVGLSVDGVPGTHNAVRCDADGKDTFDRILRSAGLLDQYQVDYNILTVVTPLVAQNIRRIYAFYRKRGWNYQQYIACLDPLGTGHGKTPFSLTPEMYGQFLITLFELWEADVRKGSFPYIRQFENYVGIAAGYLPEACDQRGNCGIQNVVEADGSVYPCDFYVLDGYCLGNFNSDSLEKIDQKRQELQFIERSRNLSEKCRGCSYHWICRGGCQRNRDQDPGEGVWHNYFCRGYQMFFEACLPKIRAIAGLI